MFRTNYQKSNAITKVKIKPSEQARFLIQKLLATSTVSERQDLSQELLDELCDSAKIDIANVKVSQTNQYHKKSKGRVVFKQYGYYRPQSRYIYIQNQTAVRGQDIAPKTFLDTLLHEWVHHYDCYKLKLNSIHSSGFYQRLKDVKVKLGL